MLLLIKLHDIKFTSKFLTKTVPLGCSLSSGLVLKATNCNEAVLPVEVADRI